MESVKQMKFKATQRSVVRNEEPFVYDGTFTVSEDGSNGDLLQVRLICKEKVRQGPETGKELIFEHPFTIRLASTGIEVGLHRGETAVLFGEYGDSISIDYAKAKHLLALEEAIRAKNEAEKLLKEVQ